LSGNFGVEIVTIGNHAGSERDFQESQDVLLCWLSQRKDKNGVIYLTGVLDPERFKALAGRQFINVWLTSKSNDKDEPLWTLKARPAPPRADLAEEQVKSGFGKPIAEQKAKASPNPYAAVKAKRESQAPLARPQQVTSALQATAEANIPFDA
jgi:hypothetical protein